MPVDAVVTVVTRTHVAQAAALFATPPMRAGGVDRYVCVIDDLPPERVPAGLRVLRPADLGLPDLRRFLFQYTPFEAVCALKPYVLRHLHQSGYERVVYFDTDIYVISPIGPVFERLASAGVLLTPHLTAPLPGDAEPGHSYIVKSGSYNAGFIGASATAGRRFLAWWAERTAQDCVDTHSTGLYVDQKWLDLAPGLFGEVAVVRDPGWNVAYWNLSHRRVTRGPAGDWRANDEPLVFFHFSGFDPARPGELSKYPNRHRIADHPAVAELAGEYAAHLSGFDPKRYASLGYGYAALADGTPIRRIWREAVRVGHPLVRHLADPFAGGPQASAVWAEVDAAAASDPLLNRFRSPADLARRLDGLERSVVFGPLLALYRRAGYLDW